MQVIYHPDAEEEIYRAANYYENCALNLGTKFLKDLDNTILEILKFPDAWTTIEADIKRHLFTHFPYGIIYRVVSRQIRILAVINLHQNPKYWKQRKNFN